MEMAEEGRSHKLSKAAASTLRRSGRIGCRFQTRMPKIAGKWTRHMDTARFMATNHEGVKRLFDALMDIWVENQYLPEREYSMDESG